MKRIFFIGIVFLSACTAKQLTTVNKAPSAGMIVDGKTFATIFQQKAAEYRALCFQAYNIARVKLDAYKPTTTKPWAIVTDIDETLLDNSPYAVHQALQGKDYEPASWAEWTAKGSADSIPGAVSFLKYAASKGVTIFYVTNRNETERTGTINNLKRFNMPNADDAHFFPRQNTSSKEARRQNIFSTHEIIMLLGDNLSDFSSLFDKKTVDERLRNTNFSAADFGNRFIILPNPVYGDWESVLYNYNRYTLVQRDSILRSFLKDY